jgi:hypothetical protein
MVRTLYTNSTRFASTGFDSATCNANAKVRTPQAINALLKLDSHGTVKNVVCVEADFVIVA